MTLRLIQISSLYYRKSKLTWAVNSIAILILHCIARARISTIFCLLYFRSIFVLSTGGSTSERAAGPIFIPVVPNAMFYKIGVSN